MTWRSDLTRSPHDSPPWAVLSTDIFVAYVEIVETFCRALARRASDAGLEALTRHHGPGRGHAIPVFSNEIVCLTCMEQPIAVGDLLVARLPNGDHSAGVISSLQVENKPDQQVDPASGPVNVGMKLDFHANDNQEFWTVKKAEPVSSLWRGRFP